MKREHASADPLGNIKLVAECCGKVRQLAGDAAEVGVYRGATAAVICKSLPTAIVHLFDTFCGMPDICQPVDDVAFGDYAATSEEIVRDFLKLKGCLNYELHTGIFPATAVDVPLVFVHVDCDLYASTKAAMEWAWRNLVGGGIILDDDYGAKMCRGAKQAVDEFLAATPEARKEYKPRWMLIHKEA